MKNIIFIAALIFMILTCSAKKTSAPKTSEDCKLPIEIGTCQFPIVQYAYNTTSEQCEELCHGGCQGNENRFNTLDDCQQLCESNKTDESKAARNACFLDMETGDCRASIPKYGFNLETRECERFVYGGCDGNGNRFSTKEECENTCSFLRSAMSCYPTSQ